MATKGSTDQRGMWTPYKELFSMVEMVIGHNKVEYLVDLEKHLASYRPAIIALLENPGKNTKQREELKKAPKDGIQIEGGYGLQKFSESFVTEALALSDALDLSEFSCVDLLISAEQQMSNFPGLSRGLVAALLYHDGRRCLVTALKLLITSRDGISWALDVDEQITTVVNQYTEELFNDGLVTKILQKLREVDVQTELDKLDQCKSVGNGKHKTQLTALITEQRNVLADCLFCWACQSPFAKKEINTILDFLKDAVPCTSDGSYDHVTLKVVMTLLVSWCVTGYEALVDEFIAIEDSKFPVFRDSDFIADIHQAIIRPDTQHWKTPSIKAVLQLGWAVFLRFLSQFQSLEANSDLFEEDEEVLSLAIDTNAFQWIRRCIIGAETFVHEEYCIRTIHALITALIVNYPLKIKDLRNRGEENARIQQVRVSEGLEATKGLRHDFQDLLFLISDLYKNDPLNLELCIDYWCPSEPFGSVFSPKPMTAIRHSLLQKQILLNKFVRLAGDLITQPMFTSYIKMLTGLCSNERSAQYCFNLLSADGTIGRSSTCSATWDHFFHSFKQYYASLKQDIYPADHPSHVHYHQNISPDELAALECVLELITALSENSENVRIAFCDNKNWLPVASFFGLIGCPVPSTLKASLLNALAAFAKSPDISTVIWQSLEATQILTTWSQDQAGKQGTGIKVELEEIEARNENYPQTRAFLKLINRLVDITIPSTLGAGYRVPGFSPYLEFLRDNVFLRLKSRAYQDSTEMWVMASSVLEIFVKILSNYEPLPEHLQDLDVEIQGVRFGKAAKPPGYELMIHLLNDTPMFRLVMNTIDVLGKELDDSLTGKNSSEERSVLHCLKLVELCLGKQAVLISMLRNESSSVMITPMDKLLLSINPSTGEADYPYKIARCMTLNNVDPELTLAVVRILYLLSQTPEVQTEIIVNLASKKIEREQLLVGFCEFLEHEAPEEQEKATDAENDDAAHTSDSAIRNAIRQNIVGLLLATLQQPSPNLAQFLLGFELQKSISKTVFQDAGVGRFPKTCFHSIISLLNRGIDSPNGPSCTWETPKLSELMYQLIYFLCAHSETGAPCQRYLRSSHDFFVTHASNLPFVRKNLLESGNEELFVFLSNQQSWLLKTIAIEIKMASQTRLRSSMVRILDVLYGQQTTQSNGFTRSIGSQPCDSSIDVISSILADLELTQNYPSPFESNMFDVSAVEQLIASCDERSEDTGVIICDVKRLHRIIMSELNNTQGMSFVGQRPEILKEVDNILHHAVERNMIRRSLGAKRHAFDAWRQVVETSFAICHYDVFTGDRREAVIVNLLQDMLMKVTDENAIPELISPVAGAILMLMAQYHNIVVQRVTPSNVQPEAELVDMVPLRRIFQGMVNCLCSTGASHWKTRSSLYGAMLYYMQIGQQQTSVSEQASSDMFATTSKESWEASTLSYIAKQGETFMEMLCRDACDGPEIGKMLAFAVLDSIVSIDWQERWAGFLSSRGYLRHLIESITADDKILQTVFFSDGDALKTVYSLESKLSFLTKFAKTEIGAQILMQSGLASKLIECQFIDQRPDESRITMQLSKFAYSQQYDPLSPTKLEQYRVVFFAVLKLMQTIVSSLGPNHQHSLSQLQAILLSHEETFLGILQASTSCNTIESLRELSIVTSVVCLLRPRYDDPENVTDENKKLRGFLSKLQRILLSLMQTFSSKEICDQITKFCIERDSSEHVVDDITQTSEVSLANVKRILLQIRSNLIGYARGVVSSSGLTGAYCNIVFSPILVDIATMKTMHDVKLKPGLKPSDTRKVSMDVLVEELEHSAEDLIVSVNNYKKYVRKMEDIEDMSAEEIFQLLSQELIDDVERLSNTQRKIIARKIIQQLLDLNDDQACLNIQIIENTLYILWRHVEYYFIHCEPLEIDELQLDLPKTPSIRARRLQDITLQLDQSGNKGKQNTSVNIARYSVTKEEIQQLKIEAKTVFTDKLLKKVMETEAIYGKARSKVDFISAMVRRIQGLIKLHSR